MSQTLILKRIAETPNSTAASLWHGKTFLCFIIEDGHHEPKIKGMTRIPAGTYKIQKAKDTRFNTPYNIKYKMDWVARVLNVPGFEGIEIHIGNTIADTNGCLLPNWSIHYAPESDTFYGENSLRAMRRLYDYMDIIQEEIFIEIIDPK